MVKETILITGGTGTIGKNIIRHYLLNSNLDILVLIHNKAKNLSIKEFFKEILEIDYEPYSNRISLTQGDITKEYLNIEKNNFESITEIIHSAASTQFDLSLNEIRKINVTGTNNVVNFALKCKNIKKFAFLSTTYVSGKMEGLIPAKSIVNNKGFVNTYEQSKYEAEKLLEKYFEKLPISIYRFSTIIGNSKTGKVEHYTAPHHALRMFYLGLASMIPGTINYIVDLIPTDTSTEIFCELLSKHFKQSQYYNICAGEINSYTLQEIINKSFESISEIKPTWKDMNLPKPEIVDRETFEIFIDSINQIENPLFSNILNLMKHFAHQLTYPKTFDTKNIEKVIPNYYKRIGNVDEYYNKVVRYCLKNRWR